MKIGIMTFHWAANYGAILQTYSLVNYLQNQFHADVEVIDYYPRNLAYSYKNAIQQIKPDSIWRKLKENRKYRLLAPFRDKLPASKRYYTNDDLMQADLEYDIIVAGSDQIWNPYFLLHGENKITPAYYLNFAKEPVRKIAVSASFGCHVFPSECGNIVIPLLQKFHSISVRENTGAHILMSLGFESVPVTADPTALMSKELCEQLCAPAPVVSPGTVSKFILRKQTPAARKLIKSIFRAYSEDRIVDIDYLPLSDWLSAIRDSKLVITNSFHCVLMCLKLHTPFAVLLENGANAGMNDRFITLLDMFQLSDRIIRNSSDIANLSKSIDFNKTDEAMERYSYTLKSYIERNIC